MCLIIGNNIEGYILKEDLIVYKQLEGNDKDGYRTPCQKWKVELDKLLKPDESEPEISNYGYKKQIKGGAIHAYLKAGGKSGIHKAIIPKGSKVWLQDDLIEIVATRMIISSEVVTEGETDLTQFIEEGSAEVKLKTGEQKKVTDSYNKDDIIGFVLKSGKVVSSNFYPTTVFSDFPLTGQTEQTNFEAAKKDMEGLANTERLKKDCKKSGLKAIERLKDNEYLPSVGELMEAFCELEAINLSRKFLNLQLIPYTWFWSSTIRNNDTMWVVFSYGDTGWNDWIYYGRRRYTVLAFVRE